MAIISAIGRAICQPFIAWRVTMGMFGLGDYSSPKTVSRVVKFFLQAGILPVTETTVSEY